MIIQRFNLNLIPNQSPVIVHVNQYDTGTGRLIATLYEGNEPYSPNGTAVIQGTKPDGHGFQYTATLDGNVVTADLAEQMSPVAGDVRTQIVVTESSGVTGTFVFIMRVQPSALPSDTDMSESDYQYIEEAIREAQEAVQTAQEATETAQEAVERAQEAITETQENAENSEAWAQGTRGGIPVGPTDPTYEHNAEYWAQYAERYAQGGLHYKGSIPFANIPTIGMREGDMYDITDDFTTDSRFEEGAGIEVKGGTNIAWNSDNKWDILALPYIPKTTFNGRSGSILPMAGDYDSKKILLSSALHIGGETQSDVQEALEALSDDGVKSFNGRSGSVLPMAGDYSAEQVNYDSNQTVKQKIDTIVTKEASDIAGQQSLLKDTVGWTGKNLLKNTATTQTINGVTFIVNADGSVTVNGTATNNSVLTLHSYSVFEFNEINAKTLILNGCPTGGGGGTYRLDVISNTETTKNLEDIGSGITVPANWFSEGTISVRLRIGNGTSVNNLTFYPMIRKADITDPTYEPYHESVEVMYEEEIHGVNLLPRFTLADLKAINANGTWNDNVYTRNGITFTVNENTQTVSINAGTATEYTNFRFNINLKELLKRDIPYTMNGMSNSIGRMFIYDRGGSRVLSENHGGDSSFVLPSSTTFSNNIELIFDVNQNVTIQATTIRPMIRLAAIDDSTYRPYNPQAIQNQLNAQGVLGAKNLLDVTANTQTLSGVTFTVNRDSDGNVINVAVNGTASANTSYVLKTKTPLAAGKSYIMSRGEAGDNDFQMVAKAWNSGSYVKNIIEVGAGGYTEKSFVADYNGYNDIQISIFVRSGKTISNAIVYPMLRLASDPDDTYQPYVMTNKELTEKVAKSTWTDTTRNIIVSKVNNVVMIDFYNANQITVAADEVFCTLPSEYRPSHDISFLEAYNGYRIIINPSGNVTCKKAINNGYIRGVGTYII